MNKSALLGIYLLAGGCTSQEQWTGIIYPVPGSLLVDVKIGTFKSYNDCAYASHQLIGHLTPGDQKAAFECGLNCTAQDSGMLLCEETRD